MPIATTRPACAAGCSRSDKSAVRQGQRRRSIVLQCLNSISKPGNRWVDVVARAPSNSDVEPGNPKRRRKYSQRIHLRKPERDAAWDRHDKIGPCNNGGPCQEMGQSDRHATRTTEALEWTIHHPRDPAARRDQHMSFVKELV